MKENYLLIPGPAPIPHTVAQAMSTKMFNHRGPALKSYYRINRFPEAGFSNRGRLFILTASGTGAMEAAIVNFLSPGEKVISLVNGSFGDRLASIAAIYGAEVERMETAWGSRSITVALKRS